MAVYSGTVLIFIITCSIVQHCGCLLDLHRHLVVELQQYDDVLEYISEVLAFKLDCLPLMLLVNILFYI